MDKYLVDPLTRWIMHSTGWTPSASKAWARTVIVVVAVIVAVVAFWLIQPQNLLP